MPIAIKNLLGVIRPHLYFLCAIFLVAMFSVVLRLHFLPLTISTDAYSYVDSARLISGDHAEKLYPGRLLKPLAPLGIAFFALFFDGNMIQGFLALNVICYFLLAIAIYFLLLLFTENKRDAMLVSLIFISTYPVLKYGLDLYSEMGTWFLFVVAIICAIRYSREPSWGNYWFATSVISIGLLWKEYAVLAGIFFGLILLFERARTWGEKFSRISLLGFACALALGVMQGIVYAIYQYTYIDWLREASVVNSALSEYSPYFIGKSLFGVFILGWGLVLLGILNWREISPDNRKLLLLLLPPSMMFLLWTFVSSRLYFIIAPLLAILALFGLRALPGPLFLRSLATILIILGNYAWLLRDSIVHFLK